MNLDVNQILNSWLTELNQFELQDYEHLPDIDLYMDQVVKYLDRSLKVFEQSSYEKQITPSMVNNYVKGNVIEAPISKKYTKIHLATLEEVTTLKQVLSISEIKQILDTKFDGTENQNSYNSFKEQFEEALKSVSKMTKSMLEEVPSNSIKELTDISLKFAIIANAYIQVSKRILYLLRHIPENDEKE